MPWGTEGDTGKAGGSQSLGRCWMELGWRQQAEPPQSRARSRVSLEAENGGCVPSPDPKATEVTLQGLPWGTQQVPPCRPVCPPERKRERNENVFQRCL